MTTSLFLKVPKELINQTTWLSSMETDHYLKFVDGKLFSAADEKSPASSAATYIHDQFRSMILSSQFPCPGARTTFSQGNYRFGVFDEMGTKETAIALGQSLRSFI